MLTRKSISFIGAGRIAEILLTNICRIGLIQPQNIYVSDIDMKKSDALSQKFGTNIATSTQEAFQFGHYTFVCVPPKFVPNVIENITCSNPTNKAIISIAAGVPINAYANIHDDIAVCRALPNPPSQIGQGIIPFAVNKNATEEQLEDIKALLSSLGKCLPINEDGIDIITSISSPAPFYLFLDTMVEAAVLLGISRDAAELVVRQTALGCMKICESRPDAAFSDLIAEASTPGGTSVETIYHLDLSGFRGIIKKAYTEGVNKAKKTSNSF